MQNKKTINRMILKLVLQAVIVSLVVIIVMIDAGLSERGNSEYSITELAQEACILASAILFGFSAKYDRQAKGFLVLVMGLFATMFIREFDAFFDKIQHGFWVYPALIITLASIFYAKKRTGTVKAPMLDYMDSKPFIYITQGLIIILVFSRTFGSGHIWRDIMRDDYSITYKTVIQEGLELLGYLFVLYGSIMVWVDAYKKRRITPV